MAAIMADLGGTGGLSNKYLTLYNSCGLGACTCPLPPLTISGFTPGKYAINGYFCSDTQMILITPLLLSFGFTIYSD